MANEPWHINKSIPVALIFTVLGQFAFGVWWASQADSRMTAAEIANIRQDSLHQFTAAVTRKFAQIGIEDLCRPDRIGHRSRAAGLRIRPRW